MEKNFSKKYAGEIFRYSIKYGFRILYEKDLTILFRESDDKRIRIMRAISNLAKFLGCYDEWRDMIKKYRLKWSNTNASFNIFMVQSFQSLLQECRSMINVLGNRFFDEVHFIALSGLRPSETFIAIKIYHEHGEKYLNKDLLILEHFRFQNFLRRTKKAFITVLDNELFRSLEKAKPLTYNCLRCFYKRRGKHLKLNYFRKLYASYMRGKGVLPEFIDLLQGRVGNSVFVKSYFRPDMEKMIEHVRSLLPELRRLLFDSWGNY